MNVLDEDRGSVSLRLGFDPPTLTDTIAGMRVDVEGCFALTARAGAPALPTRIIRVALPFRDSSAELEIEGLETFAATDEPVLVVPVQHAVRGSRSTRCAPGPPPPPSVEPTPPNMELYEQACREPRAFARLVETSRVGVTPVAVVELCPVRYASDGRLEALASISLSLRSRNPGAGPSQSLFRLSPAQAERFYQLASLTVVNPGSVLRTPVEVDDVAFPWEYLVITTATGGTSPSAGGQTFADVFQRLVDWKWSRGITGRVVTVEEIEAGEHGDFSTGSVDRAETIRRFLQWAVARWRVSWLLIGGSDDVIPARRVTGCSFAEVWLKQQDPPDPGESYWTGSFLKVHVDPSGWEGWGGWPADLVRLDSGLKIPWDPSAQSGDPGRVAVFGPQLGWYFTTDDYMTPSANATPYIRVNGDALSIQADIHFVYSSNLLPTDLYYASLYDSLYGLPGRHDWDVLRNGLYGQHSRGADPPVDLDGVSYHADVSVGRAPAHTLADAQAFVDKVISYEKGRGLDGSWVDADWHRRVVFAASNWWGGLWPAGRVQSLPLDPKQYFYDGRGKTVIRFEGTPPNVDWRLVSQVSDTDVRVLPYDSSVERGGRGWYWAQSETDEAPSMTLVTFHGQIRGIPLPTEWVVAFGTDDELTPQQFLLDQPGLDESASTQEEQRIGLPQVMPSLTDVSRLYEDDVDVPAAAVPAAPLGHLTEANLAAAMNGGPHLVSLGGHGNEEWTCDIFSGTFAGLTNEQVFIVYAGGCRTGTYDDANGMGQVAVNAGHGAVAYIGNSRDGWIPGPTTAIQHSFFDAMKNTDRLGLLHDARLQLIAANTDHDTRWNVFVQNLFGDPEMKIWKRSPSRILVTWNHAAEESKLVIRAQDEGSRAAVAGALIRVRQGSHRWTTTTNDAGEATLEVTPHGVGELDLTVSAPTRAPHVESLVLPGPGWISGTVVSLEHREPTHSDASARTVVSVSIDDADENRGQILQWTIPLDYPLMVVALAQAVAAKTPISLYVTDRSGAGTASGLRIGAGTEIQG